MKQKENSAVELNDDDVSEAAGGTLSWRMLGTWAGALAKGGGGGGGGGGMLAEASFQPLKTEPGEELPSDMTQQTPRK